jgi:protein gp37
MAIGFAIALVVLRMEPLRVSTIRRPSLSREAGVAENSKIEWTDHTFNPWIGCTKVSPACDNCYAEAMMDTRYGRVRWGSGNPRVRTSANNWRLPYKWNNAAPLDRPRPFVFCASLADVFDNEVPPEWRRDLFYMIRETPNLVWLLLTKRIGNVRKMLEGMEIPRNVAFGATMANQDEYDRDSWKLHEVKVALNPLFTFGSFEPLLGPIMLSSSAPDWIIVGGESGGNARPMELDWARGLQHDARRLGRVFNFKQVGGRGNDKGGHTLDGSTFFDRPKVAA